MNHLDEIASTDLCSTTNYAALLFWSLNKSRTCDLDCRLSNQQNFGVTFVLIRSFRVLLMIHTDTKFQRSPFVLRSTKTHFSRDADKLNHSRTHFDKSIHQVKYQQVPILISYVQKIKPYHFLDWETLTPSFILGKRDHGNLETTFHVYTHTLHVHDDRRL